ncbi:unnamed protein product, partial [Brassica rapa subsp. narinosa]
CSSDTSICGAYSILHSFRHTVVDNVVNENGIHSVVRRICNVSSDGNCQFRALSDQLYRSSEYHKQVRGEVVKQLKDNRTIYESYVLMKYKRYYKRMAKMGDHITLQAAADRFAAKICLLTSFRDTCFIEILPQDQAPKRAYGKCTLTKLWLYMFGIVHYNSLYDNQAVPVQQKPKRKHWLF